MMKKIISLIMAIIISVLCIVPAYADDNNNFTSGDYEYKLNRDNNAIIKKYNGSLYWEKSGNKMSPLDYLSKVDQSNKPQTRALINAYHQFGRQDIVRIIDEVNIMTPESIHFNSFMYEPLLDMDVSELFSLYRRVQALQA